MRNRHSDNETSEEENSTEYHSDSEEPIIEMAEGSSANSASKETKKKLKTPTPYTGKREDLRKFLQEVRLYLLANNEAYQTDLDKILFVISYMSEGDASSWKEEFVDTADQKAVQDGTPFDLGTYDDFIKLVTQDFSPYDAPKDAIHEMKEMTMGNTPIEEHVAKFKMLVTKSRLAKNDAVAEYFRETLPIALQREIMKLPDQPTDLNDWYKWAIQLQNNFIRMKNAIAKTQARGGQTPGRYITPNARKPADRSPRRFYFEPHQHKKDPNAMDIDYMSAEDRTEMMRKGLCFKCGKAGHRAGDPEFHPENQRGGYTPLRKPTEKPKMKGKELHTHIKALLAQMDEEEKNEFFEDASKEGF